MAALEVDPPVPAETPPRLPAATGWPESVSRPLMLPLVAVLLEVLRTCSWPAS